MRDLILEELSFGANPSAKDLARHLFTRMMCGRVLIIADNPGTTLSSLRKQWLKLTRRLQREVSSTLDAIKLAELTNLIIKMHNLRFSTAAEQAQDSDVFITSMLAIQYIEGCSTIYISSKQFTSLKQHRHMHQGVILVVICNLL